jgi:hypothetical protein
MVEHSPFNGEFIIEGGNNSRTFLLEDVLIILDGFILIKGCEVLLSTVRWIGWVVIFNKCEWIGNVPVMELYVKEFMIIQWEVWGGFNIL